jgi:hypothetical protein
MKILRKRISISKNMIKELIIIIGEIKIYSFVAIKSYISIFF